ncbi:hypothetical protein [Rhodoferax sp. U11-2br]|uniref:hypothetical protein n=1 Tax=Rhodoferax sp. U11-2br TaxID=2838878 RepID=UPI001BE7EAC5|nr:hypothetical protein [Rhodoferax sp. U11-2br]MBT3066486.1 hypothetical protein [Rhodoferax sp. U11-2br]
MQTTNTPMGLSRGQSHAAHFKRGAVITVASGSVRVISRVWLDHTSLTTQTPLLRGGVFYVPCSGWLEISADSDAQIGLGQQPGGLKPVKRGWRVMAGICERFQPPDLVLSG